jgi:hydroxypyruvate isomerase
LKTHLDEKAICSGDEANLGLFKKVQPTLAHFHANDPGLGILGETGEVDHMLLGRLLKQINYQGCVSMEQKMIDQAEPLKPIKKSFSVLRENYK